MNFKQSLDRYLTTVPDDGFDGWAEDVIGNKISDIFYETNESWLTEYPSGLCNKWLNKLLYKSCKTPEEAAKIIERAFNIYIQNN